MSILLLYLIIRLVASNLLSGALVTPVFFDLEPNNLIYFEIVVGIAREWSLPPVALRKEKPRSREAE